METELEIDTAEATAYPIRLPQPLVFRAEPTDSVEEPAGNPIKDESSQWAVLAGLRFVLALCVVMGHIEPYLSSRWDFMRVLAPYGMLPAVLAFFLVSGFSIRASIEKDKSKFYQRRIARIYPVYLCALAISTLPYVIFGSYSDTAHNSVSNIPVKDYLLDIFFLQRYGPSLEPPANLPLWTISIEVGFYALAPLFLRLSRTNLYRLIGASALFYAGCRLYHILPDAWANQHLGILQLAWVWLLGWAMYAYRQSAGVTIAALLLTIFFFPYDGGVSTASAGAFTLAATVVLLRWGHMIKLKPRIKPVLNYLGDISYPVYAIHFPIVTVIYMQSYSWLSWLYVVPVIGASMLMYHLVDRPARRWINSLDLTKINRIQARA